MRLEVAKRRQGRIGGVFVLAAGHAGHPVAREEAMIVGGRGLPARHRRPTSIERVVRLALGVFQLPAERLDALATDRRRRPSRPSPKRRGGCRVPLVACTVADLDRVARPGA